MEPLRAPDAPQVAAPMQAPGRGGPGGGRPGKRVLVVDDEPDILSSMAACLEFMAPECAVLEAGNAQQALAVLNASPVDVLVSDLRMPGMDGLGLLQVARERWPATRRLLVTAFYEEGLEERAKKAGAERVLRKPFRPADFVAAVLAAP